MSWKVGLQAEKEMGDSKTPLAHYTVVRPSNYLDRMFYIQHRVGAQANVIVLAHYDPVDPTGVGCLSREAVYSATRSVIEKYPELSLVGVLEPSGKKGHHGLHLGALHEIDLELCVEFLDDAPPRALAETIESLHNQWEWTDEKFNPRQPWWKVVVLGKQEVAFVFHHLICDGRFGQMFHEEFLTALNLFDEKSPAVSRIVKIDPEMVRLSKEVEEFWVSTTSVLRIIHNFFAFLVLRIFLGSRLLFSNAPKAKPHSKSITKEAGPENRTKTRVTSLRIPATQMENILTACREQKATFTPLVLVMIMCTLACDYYPKAKVGVSNCALDMRSLYPQDNTSTVSGRLLECGGGHSKFTWLDRCRQLCYDSTPNGTNSEKAKMNANGLWEMVREYRASLAQGFQEKDSRLLVMFRAANSALDDLEGMLNSAFPALGLYLNKSFQVTNLGVFPTKQQGHAWKIDDISFSASAVNADISYKINIAISGVEGGDTVILASYEDGVVTKELVSGVLEATVKRIEAMLQ